MMRVSTMFLLGCLGWFAGLDAQAGIFCHSSCCTLVERSLAAPAVTNAAVATPAAAACAAAPANLAYVVPSGVAVGPQFVVYGIPQGWAGGAAAAEPARVAVDAVSLQNLLDAAQQITSALGGAAQPTATIQPPAAAGDVAAMHQDIRNLQRDVALLKIRCAAGQAGSPTSDAPVAQPAPAAGGAGSDVGQLAVQVQRLSDTLTQQNRRLEQLATDVQSLKARAAPAAGGTPPTR
jgi:hypothetical protein